MCNRIVFYFIVVIFINGCATHFVNNVNITIRESANVKSKVIGIVESIATKHELSKDSRNSIKDKQLCYFGVPYHYYCLYIDESNNNEINVKFVHDARLSSRKYKKDEPEKTFLKEVTNLFGSNVIEESHNIIQ